MDAAVLMPLVADLRSSRARVRRRARRDVLDCGYAFAAAFAMPAYESISRARRAYCS
jgi:hypothetical protein